MSTALRSLFLGAAFAALFTGCSGGSKSPSDQSAQPASPPAVAGARDADKVVNVYNWSDYIDPTVITDFQKEYGIKVNYDVFDSNEVLETKLLTGHTNYDVVGPSGAFLARQIQAGVFQKLNKALLPNWKYLDPEVAKKEAQYDPDNAYAMTYMWITSGPGYDIAKVKQRMPDAPVDSWRMLYDPAVVSKFADCGVSLLDAPSEVVPTVLIYLGKDPNSTSADDLAAAEKALMAIRPYVRYVHSSRYIDDLANGETCLALGWSGDVKQAHDRAKDAGKGIDIGYSIPKEGAISNYDTLAIPADAPHPNNAHLFMNFLLRPDIAARSTNLIKYANGDSPTPAINDGVRNDPGIYPPPEVLAKLHPEPTRTSEYTRMLTRVWTRFKTGK
ncbi:MAG TPA: polyamine ABC transporter substrate-binding protein [Steroidobacteraceae bacterium]|nr:polyamine ABC transporter substrate-binding protein [Steroidobacteraceae bacterium]